MCRNSKSENRNSAQFELRFLNFNFQSSNFQFRAWVILALLGCIFRPQYGLAGHSKPVSAKLDQPGVSYRNADRKSTRLNSSHVRISYAVFCLKKKNKIERRTLSNEWKCV